MDRPWANWRNTSKKQSRLHPYLHFLVGERDTNPTMNVIRILGWSALDQAGNVKEAQG